MMLQSSRARAGVVMLVMLGACASTQTYDAASPVEERGPGVAYASEGPVELWVEADVPDAQHYTRPVLAFDVRLRNQGNEPVRVAHGLFSLTTRTQAEALETTGVPATSPGEQVVARPLPLPIPRGIVTTTTPPGPEQRGLEMWPGPFSSAGATGSRDSEWRTPYPSSRRVRMPLREGSLAPGDVTRGYVFFPVPAKTFADIDFVFELENAVTGEKIGRVHLPLTRTGNADSTRGHPLRIPIPPQE